MPNHQKLQSTYLRVLDLMSLLGKRDRDDSHCESCTMVHLVNENGIADTESDRQIIYNKIGQP